MGSRSPQTNFVNVITWSRRTGARRSKGKRLCLWPRLSRRPQAWYVCAGHEARLTPWERPRGGKVYQFWCESAQVLLELGHFWRDFDQCDGDIDHLSFEPDQFRPSSASSGQFRAMSAYVGSNAADAQTNLPTGPILCPQAPSKIWALDQLCSEAPEYRSGPMGTFKAISAVFRPVPLDGRSAHPHPRILNHSHIASCPPTDPRTQANMETGTWIV